MEGKAAATSGQHFITKDEFTQLVVNHARGDRQIRNWLERLRRLGTVAVSVSRHSVHEAGL